MAWLAVFLHLPATVPDMSTPVNKVVSVDDDNNDGVDDRLIMTGSFSLKFFTLMLENVSHLIKLISW